MKQKIKIPITGKIINKKDIEDIATYIYSLKKTENDYFNIIIKFNNDMEISSDDLSCLNSRKIEEYEIKQIRIAYRDEEYTDEIDVDVNNWDEFEFSYIEISSSDEEKLGSMEHKLTELLKFCKTQSKINNIFKHNCIFAIFIGSTMATFTTVCCLIFIKKYTEDYRYYTLTLFALFATLYYYIFKKLFKSYPNIEIDINDKTNKSKKRRNLILGILTLIIIPILLNIGYDILKILFNK